MNDAILAELPDLSTYEKYHEQVGLTFDDGTTSDYILGTFYQKDVGGKTISVGVFSSGDRTLFAAWGYKDDTHCGYHAVMGSEGAWLPATLGCPIKIAIKKDGENIGLAMPSPSGEQQFIF